MDISLFRFSVSVFIFSVFLSVNAQAVTLHGEKLSYQTVYEPTKTGVMKALDKMNVDYTVDADGDLLYTFNDKGWTGYIIFSYTTNKYTQEKKQLWSLQVRTQFATKVTHYEELVEYANSWNANQKVPKISMKNRSKMVLSINYPVQFGFNPKEFKVNVFDVFNRTAQKIGAEINPMRL